MQEFRTENTNLQGKNFGAKTTKKMGDLKHKIVIFVKRNNNSVR